MPCQQHTARNHEQHSRYTQEDELSPRPEARDFGGAGRRPRGIVGRCRRGVLWGGDVALAQADHGTPRRADLAPNSGRGLQVAKIPQIHRHCARAWIPIVGVFCHGLGDEVIEHRRDVLVATARRCRHFVDNLAEDRVEVPAEERRETGQCLVEHGAQRKDVGASVDLAPDDLLGRHVLGRAEDAACRRA